jgi:hypothetical protein
MAKDPKDRKQTIEVVKRNGQAEVETAQTYRDLAECERDGKRKSVLHGGRDLWAWARVWGVRLKRKIRTAWENNLRSRLLCNIGAFSTFRNSDCQLFLTCICVL